MNNISQQKNLTALDKIRNKIESNILAAQQPEPVQRPCRIFEPPLPPKRERPHHPARITFPTFFCTFIDVTFRRYSDFDDMINDSHWNQERVIFPESRIQIQVPYGLIAKSGSFPPRIELATYNLEPFTSGQLFYQIHKALVESAANPSRLLRGAKLIAHPHHWPSEDEPYLYGFYTKNKSSLNCPY